MLGFLIPFSGIGSATAVIALTIYALLPMVRSVHTGLTNVDPAIVEAAKGMGSTRVQILFKVKLPLAMPVIMSGIRNMVTMTIALAGIASFIGAGGLGVAIYRGITTNNTAMTIAGSLLTALLALIADLILSIVEKRMQKHSKKAKRQNKAMGITALVLAGCLIVTAVASQRQSSKTVHIATKPMTEQYVLGEMLDILIEQDTGLKYQALEEKQIDVMVVFTTDGQLSTADAVVLTDDKDFFPSYLCGNVVRSEVLEKYPELQDVFNTLTGQIQNEDMVEMNYEVEVEGKEPRDVAEAFLEERGLIR
jgi:uncharacterized protein YjgD (DUF1641 family)